MSEELDGPIEIELTSHAPKRERHRRGAASGDIPPAPLPSEPHEPCGRLEPSLQPGVGHEPQPGWLGSERSRLLVSVSVAAVIALLIGWMLGRTGDGSDAAGGDVTPVETSQVGTTEPDDDEDVDPAFEDAEELPDEDVDPAFEDAEELPDADVDLDELFTPETTTPVEAEVEGDEPPSTTEEPNTTDEPEEPEPESIEIAFDERVLGSDLTLITVDGQRRLLEIDLSTGAVTQRGEPLPSVADGVLGGSDWVGVATQGSGRLFIDRDDGTRTAIDDVAWWNLAIDPAGDAFWSSGTVYGPDVASFVERGLDGEATGRTIELPSDAWSAIFDDGAFLTTAVGTTYRIDPDGHEAITSGQLLAASSKTLLVSDCDEDLQCGLRVVDRESGDGRWLPPGPGESDQRYFPLQWYYGTRSEGYFSPDDRWMLAVAPTEFSQDVGLVDLTTGEFVRVEAIGSEGFDVSWTWAPDSRSAFFVQGRVPWVYDVDTREAFRLSEDLLAWSSIVIRPNGAG